MITNVPDDASKANSAAGSICVDTLFSPITIAGCEIPNRIVMAPMTRSFAVDGIPPQATVDYYRRRAEGGVGLILTEGLAINEIGALTGQVPHFFGEEALRIWRDTANAVHAAGGKIMPQLWHVGLGRMEEYSANPAEPNIGPTDRYPRPADLPPEAYPGFNKGRAMTEADIIATIDSYAKAALAAKQSGFDGVEIHAAHGYLIDQFFWDRTNTRKDRWGGGQVARTRFGAEIVAACRRAVGAGFPIGLRYSQWKLPNYYDAKLVETPQELETFLRPLVDAGVDFFDCSLRRFWEPAFEGSDLNLSGWTKKLTGKAAMTVGSVGLDAAFTPSLEGIGNSAGQTDLTKLIELFERGDFDLVGVGRALIADPAWASKVRSGQYADLIPYCRDKLEQLH